MRISDWSSDVCSSDLDYIQSEFSPKGHAMRYSASIKPISYLKANAAEVLQNTSEERRVGEACVSTCRSRWSRYHSKNTTLNKLSTTVIIICTSFSATHTISEYIRYTALNSYKN